MGLTSRKRCRSCTAKASARGWLSKGLEQRGKIGIGLAGGAQEAIGKLVGLLAGGAAAHDMLREAPQIFDEHDADSDGHGPEFADGERLHALIRGDESAQHLGIEAAVGMRDEGPGDSVNTRIALQVAGGEFRQLAVKAGRQVFADFPELLIDDIEIVDQPFGGGGDGVVLLDGSREFLVALKEHAAVFHDARRERFATSDSRFNGLRGGKSFGVLLEPLDAEQFGANRFFENGRAY